MRWDICLLILIILKCPVFRILVNRASVEIATRSPGRAAPYLNNIFLYQIHTFHEVAASSSFHFLKFPSPSHGRIRTDFFGTQTAQNLKKTTFIVHFFNQSGHAEQKSPDFQNSSKKFFFTSIPSD